jgi:hypothetical protein
MVVVTQSSTGEDNDMTTITETNITSLETATMTTDGQNYRITVKTNTAFPYVVYDAEIDNYVDACADYTQIVGERLLERYRP